MSELIALINKPVSSGSSYLDWSEGYTESTGTRFQNHADGTRFNGEMRYSVQNINQAEKGNADSNYYSRFSKMQKRTEQGYLSEEGSTGTKIYFIEQNKGNNSAIVSSFKYDQAVKLNESQVFHYQSGVLTDRTLFLHDSSGRITKSDEFNIHDELVESNTFSYKNENIADKLITIKKEKYHGNKVTNTTHKELYDFSGKIIKTDVYDNSNNHLERNDFSYFNNGEKCQTVRSVFNVSGNLNYQEKIIYNKNGDLFEKVHSNYNNGKYLKDSKSTYYTEGEVSRITESEYSTDGKVILEGVERIYDITNAKLVQDTRLIYSMNGELKREVERKLDINGNVKEHISQYYSDGVNLTRHITRSFADGKITGGVDIKFDHDGNVSRIKRRNSEGVIVDGPINATIDSFFKGITQLADAINSFPTKERAPASVETMISGTLGPRNLVPNMNYASRQ